MTTDAASPPPKDPDADGDCPICGDPLRSQAVHPLPGCGHDFHTDCIVHLFRMEPGGACPICRDTGPAIAPRQLQLETDPGEIVVGMDMLPEIAEALFRSAGMSHPMPEGMQQNRELRSGLHRATASHAIRRLAAEANSLGEAASAQRRTVERDRTRGAVALQRLVQGSRTWTEFTLATERHKRALRTHRNAVDTWLCRNRGTTWNALSRPRQHAYLRSLLTARFTRMPPLTAPEYWRLEPLEREAVARRAPPP